MDKPFIISWKSGDVWHGKAIVMAPTAIQAWEKFIDSWTKELETESVDLDFNEIDRFAIEIAADEFIA